ncbi:hypothetical protein [Sporomusa rhizae]|uniref:hypothetical protein n=1 Tax=Sporomusa rhizae TaxID=357999 RepID=UPI003529DD5D
MDTIFIPAFRMKLKYSAFTTVDQKEGMAAFIERRAQFLGNWYPQWRLINMLSLWAGKEKYNI